MIKKLREEANQLVAILGSVMMFSSSAAQAADLILLTEDRAPTNMLLNGKLIGSATDTVREILDRAHLSGQFDVVPWQRALSLAQTQSNTCAFATRRSAERETQFQWIGPVATAQMVLYRRNDIAMDLHSLEDARRYRIGGYLGDAFGEKLRALGYLVELTSRNDLNLNKLMAGRIDLWIGNPSTATLVKDQMIIPAFVLPPVALYLACNLHLSRREVTHMTDALHQMGRDGTSLAIARKYRNVPLRATIAH